MKTTISVKGPNDDATQLGPITRVQGVLLTDDNNPERIGAVKGFNESTVTNSGTVVVYVLEAQISTGRNLVPVVPTCDFVIANGMPIQPGNSLVQKDKFFGWGGFFAAVESGTGELRTI